MTAPTRAEHRADLTFSLAGGGGRVPVALRYDTANPFAVTAEFPPDCDGPVVWRFARDMLIDALDGRVAGAGDVTVVLASRRSVEVTFSSPQGRVTGWLCRGAVARFVARTMLLVPVGRESVDVDGFLARLLGGAA